MVSYGAEVEAGVNQYSLSEPVPPAVKRPLILPVQHSRFARVGRHRSFRL